MVIPCDHSAEIRFSQKGKDMGRYILEAQWVHVVSSTHRHEQGSNSQL